MYHGAVLQICAQPSIELKRNRYNCSNSAQGASLVDGEPNTCAELTPWPEGCRGTKPRPSVMRAKGYCGADSGWTCGQASASVTTGMTVGGACGSSALVIAKDLPIIFRQACSPSRAKLISNVWVSPALTPKSAQPGVVGGSARISSDAVMVPVPSASVS